MNLRLKRGTTSQNNAYLGPSGELTVDLDLKELRLHDGSTTGGIPIAQKNHYHSIPVVNVTNNYSASRGEYCLVNAADLTITFPANPNVGDVIYVGTINHNVTINRNGQKIMGQENNLVIDIANSTVGFIFTGSNHGWKVF